MPDCTILVLSDIHYACAAEQARAGYEFRAVSNSIARHLLRLYRDHIWLRNPTAQNHLLDQFLAKCGAADCVVANGDYSCNTAFIGISDDAAYCSVAECLTRLRERFEGKLLATIGDHELGKFSLLGNQGGMRMASWQRLQSGLGLKPFWRCEIGNYVLLGITSSLVALPVFEPETLPSEREHWRRLRDGHMQEIQCAFETLRPQQKVLLFCHDPTAIPFLSREPVIRARLPRVECTIIGHLHSPLVLWKSRLLSGMPAIRFFGNSIRRFSTALREARHWHDFNVHLCPSLAGIELLKDGGYLRLELDPQAHSPIRILRQRIAR